MDHAALVLVVFLAGCGTVTKLLDPAPQALHTGLVVQNPTCFVFCFGENRQYLHDTDISTTPYGRGKTAPDLFYP